MLGHDIKDPWGVEDSGGEIAGLNFLPISSVMEKTKVTTRVCGMFQLPGVESSVPAEGYEIHMGKTCVIDGHEILWVRKDELLSGMRPAYEVASVDGQVWGTYLHGLFENDAFRNHFLTWVCSSHGCDYNSKLSYAAFKETNYDKLASIFEQQVNVAYILKHLGIQ